MSSEEIIAKWRKRLKDERLAPRTISFYVETIHAVLALMEKLKLQTHPHTINAEDVQKLLDYLKDEQYAVQTRKGYLTTLRRFCRSFENPWIEQWPKPRFPHDTRPNADWLDAEQAQQLLHADKSPIQTIVVHLELCLGLRHVEVIRLRKKDIDRDTKTILVRGKGPEGGKLRTVPYAVGTEGAIGIWGAHRNQMVEKGRRRHPVTFEDPEEFIVWSKAGVLHPYSEEGYGLDKVVTLPLSEALGFSFSNHTLRRTFGRALYRADVPVATIAAILGHESTDVTLKYIGVNLDDMRDAMRREIY